jgi:hypothetical protein
MSKELSDCGALWLVVKAHTNKFLVCAYLATVSSSHEDENIWRNSGLFLEPGLKPPGASGLLLSQPSEDNDNNQTDFLE